MTILCSVFVPIFFGALLLLCPKNSILGKREKAFGYSLVFMLISAAFSVAAIALENGELHLFDLTEKLPVIFRIDDLGRIFALIVTIVWILCHIFSYEYMKHEQNNKRYFGYYLLLYGILMGLCFAGNIVTFYGFYELMTLLSAPLVIHNQSREAIMACLKYMFFSFCGAYMSLFGIFFLCRYAKTLSFVPGGCLNIQTTDKEAGLLLIVAFFMILGFSVKAGMFPMHAWLPTAHPVAPAPASAVLSGLIVKAGVLGIIRTVFYLFGADFIRGTWVQTAWMILALLTVFMGSMLAYREDVLKKRLAYSTVSQLSYILFGLSVLSPDAFKGAILHVIFHAFIKSLLFLGAGAIIYKTGCHRASELKGIGKKMPVTIWCFAIASLALIGIPPTGGFLSKWYLATGALYAGIPVFSILGPVVLLVSALLTAGYLLPVVVDGFFPGEDYDYKNHRNLEKDKGMLWMLIPMVILAALSLLPGMFPGEITSFIDGIVPSLF